MGIQRCHALSRLADIAACHSLPAACQKLLNADLPAACQRLPKMQTCMQPFDMGRLRTLHAQVVLSQPSKRHTSSRPHLPAVLHAQVCIYGLHAHLPRVSIAHHHVDQKKKGILRKKEACKPLQAARRMSYSHVTLGLPIKCQTCLLMHCPALHQVTAQLTCSGRQQCPQRLCAAIASALWPATCKPVTALLTCQGCQTCPQPFGHGPQGPPWLWPPPDGSAPQRCSGCRHLSAQ